MNKAPQLIDRVQRFDTELFLRVNGSTVQLGLGKAARAVSRSGDGYCHIALAVSLSLFEPLFGDCFLMAVAGGFCLWLPVYWILKNTLRRQRPPEALPSFNALIVASDKFSFPSGHTAGAFLLASLCIGLYGAIAMPMLIWACLVGCSRVILGVHFPTDILAGAILGTGFASIGLFIAQSLISTSPL